ncbi:MAG TPA: tetratricopeptide repeat protein [Ktedonobacteraceae bacterium]|nr:tetratricopeptide repeat protein [Ktedonobacteraceae bacterium]
MTQTLSTEEKARLKKQWTDLAIKQAQEGQWEEAVTTNRNILNLFPTETDALNRLGKAYSELGMYVEAQEAYSQTLKIKPDNNIAKKNLERLALILESVDHTSSVRSVTGERLDTNLYIDETGKTGITELLGLAPAAILAKVSIGDKIQLHVSGHTLYAQTLAGETIGQLEPRLSNRLVRFIEGGNRYAAAVIAMEPGLVRIRIRETYQHPSLFGQVSFPSQGSGDTFRSYIKGTLLRDREDEDELGNDDEYYDGGDDGDDVADVETEGEFESEE